MKCINNNMGTGGRHWPYICSRQSVYHSPKQKKHTPSRVSVKERNECEKKTFTLPACLLLLLDSVFRTPIRTSHGARSTHLNTILSFPTYVVPTVPWAKSFGGGKTTRGCRVCFHVYAGCRYLGAA